MKPEFLLDAIGEISEKYISEAAPGRRRARPWLGTAITAAAAVLVIGMAALTIPRLHPVSEPLPPEAAPLEAEAEGPAGADNENMLRYHNLNLTGDAAAYLSPETVELGIFQDAVFTEDEIGTAVQKLIDAGWEDMTSVNYEGIAVFFSQPEKDPPPLEETIAEKQNESVQISEFDLERARQFIADSGLDALIYEKTGVTLVLEADPTRSVVVFYGYKDGMKTNTYVRMSFYENGDLAEAKLYAVISETRTIPMLPVEEAVKNAYGLVLYGGGDNYEEIAVTAVRFEYVDGLPYYVLTLDEMLANGPMEARALAVDFSLIEEDGDLLAAWERQFNLP